LLKLEKRGYTGKGSFRRFFKARCYILTSPKSQNVRKSGQAAANDRRSRRAGKRCWFDPKPFAVVYHMPHYRDNRSEDTLAHIVIVASCDSGIAWEELKQTPRARRIMPQQKSAG